MKEIFIKHNPYRLITDITIDGEQPEQNSRLLFGEKRLQEWVEDLPKILHEEYNSKEFKIIFHGTTLDYEDVQSVVNDANKNGMEMTLEHKPAKEVSDKEAAIQAIFDKIQEGPFDELRAPDMVKAFELAKSSDFEVCVVATMSAGKSTLINALLRQKLMPSKQEACTATITEIKDTDSDHFSAEAYNSEGVTVGEYDNLTYDIMSELNGREDVSRIRVEGDIPFVGADDTSLVLVDTPGPNNSRDPGHRETTFGMLSKSSKAVVLYVMNATQLGINDDCSLLHSVSESMKVGGKQSRDRFIFVVNKLDEFRNEEDSVKSTIDRVRSDLQDKGIENPNIYPASALTALDIRTILTGDVDKKNLKVREAELKVELLNQYEQLHFEEYAPLPPSARNTVDELLKDAVEKGDANAQAIIHTGIVPIEQAIKTYVQKYAKTAKIKNIADTFVKKLESARIFEVTKQKIADNQDKCSEISTAIAKIQKKLDDGDNAKQFKEKIENIDYETEINKSISDTIRQAQTKITESIEPNKKKDTKPAFLGALLTIYEEEKDKISVDYAKKLVKNFRKFAEDLETQIQVKLKDIIENQIYKNAKDLTSQYKDRLNELASEVQLDEISFTPFEILKGDIETDTASIVSKIMKKESVKVNEHWVKNTHKKWYKPWTWFDESGHWEGEYEDREYVSKVELTQKYFAPIQKNLHQSGKDAKQYAKKQTDVIKEAFLLKFDELDKLLEDKLKELKKFTADKSVIEAELKKSQERLEWLNNIQKEVNDLLDI